MVVPDCVGPNVTDAYTSDTSVGCADSNEPKGSAVRGGPLHGDASGVGEGRVKLVSPNSCVCDVP